MLDIFVKRKIFRQEANNCTNNSEKNYIFVDSIALSFIGKKVWTTVRCRANDNAFFDTRLGFGAQ